MKDIKVVLCDIEGTTTSLAFVHDVLFPLSRKEIDSFVRQNWTDPIFRRLASNSPEEAIQLLQDWISADKKETVLKEIQGRIWKDAFESGQIKAHIYPDVPARWSDWKSRGIRIYIFSSGSVQAQQLLFRYSEAGDLTTWIDGYFDTTTGPKKEPSSYSKIAESIGTPADHILFLSDVPAELNAARDAGMKTIQLIRGPVEPSDHPRATTFAEIP